MSARRSIAERYLHALCLVLALTTGTADAIDGSTATLLSLRNIQIPDTPTQKEWKSSALAKISPTLLEFNDAAIKGNVFSVDLQETAKSLGIAYDDGKIAIKLAARNNYELDALSRSIREVNGNITFTFENTIFAMVPANSILMLERFPALDYAAPQSVLAPTAVNRSPNEGSKTTGVERLHAAGITGKGIKIGIIDFGFKNYQKLAGTSTLPQPKATRAFNKKRSMDNDEIHGTACAEIIHSMAPDAELYLAAIDGQDSQIMQAAEWLVQQGVDIISFSGGSNYGPINGNDILSRFVDQLVNKSGNRLLWVNSAGNYADNHWLGMTTDSNRSNLIDIPTPDDPQNKFMLMQGGSGPMAILINWDDWGQNPEKPSANIDIDAELFLIDGDKKPIKVASSNNPQRGRGEPIEFILLKKPEKDKQYLLALRSRKIDRPVRLHVTIRGGEMFPTRAEGSIGNPATARLALAVGAVDVSNQQLEEFSSQGPTDDGRLKPEISAPDNTLSLSYQSVNEERFPGTSAACPHVSGYSALLKQMQPDIGRDELIKRIIAYATPMGEGQPNNQYGYGHISATKIDLAGNGNAPPPAAGGSASSGRGNNRVFQPILDIMKQSGQ